VLKRTIDVADLTLAVEIRPLIVKRAQNAHSALSSPPLIGWLYPFPTTVPPTIK
jgi:hypothetical protein